MYCSNRREDILDAEVSASGFTKQMEKDLLTEIGLGDEQNVEEEQEELTDKEKEEDIECLRQKLEKCVANDWKTDPPSKEEVQTTTSATQEEIKIPEPISVNKIPTMEKTIRNKDVSPEENLSDYGSDEENSDAETEVHSVRSVSTTSTIPPEVIRDRVKKALERRHKQASRLRCLAKGEASATTRSRRENRDTIKDSSGIWGWE